MKYKLPLWMFLARENTMEPVRKQTITFIMITFLLFRFSHSSVNLCRKYEDWTA
jgi:hypothetical protein